MIPSGPDGLYGYERHYDFDLKIELSCYWPDYEHLWEVQMGSNTTRRIYQDVLEEKGFEELAHIRQQLVRIWNLADKDFGLLQEALESLAHEGEVEKLEETPLQNPGIRARLKVTDENRDQITSLMTYQRVLTKITKAIPYRINIIDEILTRFSIFGLAYRGSHKQSAGTGSSNPTDERIAWKGSFEQLQIFGDSLAEEGLIQTPKDVDVSQLLMMHFHLADDNTEPATKSTPRKPIWWQETNTLLLHLFDLLLSHGLIDTDIIHRQSACIAEHFIDKKGNQLDNKRLNKSRYQMDEPQRADRVERVVQAVLRA